MSLVKRLKKWLSTYPDGGDVPPGPWLNDPKLNKLFTAMIEDMRKKELEHLKRTLERLDKP